MATNNWSKTDLYLWENAFSDQTADSDTGEQPPDSTHFRGGQRVAALLIDYELSLTDSEVAEYAATLDIYLYNSTRETYQYWKSYPLQTGNNRIKVDIHGSPGGLKLSGMDNATLNWLDFSYANRETGGN